jgi:glycerophosphoryl diester phosphodiesterase
VRNTSPAIRLGVLGDKEPGRMLETGRRLRAWSVNPRFDLASPDFCREAHKLGLRVLVWTVDVPELVRRMIGNGADGIMTNFPGRLNEVFKMYGQVHRR